MTFCIGRREFITLLGGAVAWPPAARAQQADRVRRIGMLMLYSQTDREGQARVAAFLDTLQRLGWTDGRNVRIEYRWSAGDAGREKAFAAELVRSTPDVIVVSGWTGLAELKRLTSMIPIVFTQVSDPVGSGLVASLARPGANISGFQNFEPAMGGKWLGVLKDAAPNMRRAAVLFGSDSVATVEMLHAAEAVAPSLDVQVTAVDVHGGVEIERAIDTFASQPDGGLIVLPHPYAPANRGSIILLAARHRLPAVYPNRYFAAEGGLMSYGPNQIDQWRGAATYVDRILRGNQRQGRQGDRIEYPASIPAPRRRGNRVTRRAFITLLGGAATAWPLTARAQQAAMSVVGSSTERYPLRAEYTRSPASRGARPGSYCNALQQFRFMGRQQAINDSLVPRLQELRSFRSRSLVQEASN